MFTLVLHVAVLQGRCTIATSRTLSCGTLSSVTYAAEHPDHLEERCSLRCAVFSLLCVLVQTGDQTLTPMREQITLGWDYWNKKKHNLRRDMLQLHYYLLLEAEMTVCDDRVNSDRSCAHVIAQLTAPP
jgi:hypothetical protein